MTTLYHGVASSNPTTIDNDEETTDDSTSFWINGVLTLALVIVGVCGNVVMMISLGCNTKRWLPLYYYFMTFAVWNTTLLLATVVFYCLTALQPNHVHYYENPIFAYLNIIGYPLANSGMTASVWLVLCLTMERCLVVSRPLQRVVSQTKRRAKIVTSAISILAPVYSIPLFFELCVREMNYENETVPGNASTFRQGPFYDVVKTGLRDDTSYKIIYRVACNLLFLSLVPFVIVIAMSGRIVFVIRRRADKGDRRSSLHPNELVRRRQQSQVLNPVPFPTLIHEGSDDRRGNIDRRRFQSRSSYDNNQRTHLTLTILALKYVICYTLPTLLNILELIVVPKSLREMGLGLLVDLSDLMVVADSALNAFVYFSWRRKIQLRGLSFRSKIKAAQRTNSLRIRAMKNRNQSV